MECLISLSSHHGPWAFMGECARAFDVAAAVASCAETGGAVAEPPSSDVTIPPAGVRDCTSSSAGSVSHSVGDAWAALVSVVSMALPKLYLANSSLMNSQFWHFTVITSPLHNLPSTTTFPVNWIQSTDTASVRGGRRTDGDPGSDHPAVQTVSVVYSGNS